MGNTQTLFFLLNIAFCHWKWKLQWTPIWSHHFVFVRSWKGLVIHDLKIILLIVLLEEEYKKSIAKMLRIQEKDGKTRGKCSMYILEVLCILSLKEKRKLIFSHLWKKRIKRNKAFEPKSAISGIHRALLEACDSPWVEKIMSLSRKDQQWADFSPMLQTPVTRQWPSRLCRRKIGQSQNTDWFSSLLPKSRWNYPYITSSQEFWINCLSPNLSLLVAMVSCSLISNLNLICRMRSPSV